MKYKIRQEKQTEATDCKTGKLEISINVLQNMKKL